VSAAPRPVRAAARAFRAIVAIWPARVARDRREEITGLFVDLAAEAYVRRGWRGLVSAWLRSAGDLLLGSASLTRRTVRLAGTRAARTCPHLADDLAQDLRFACRRLRRTPGFTGAAALILALGIGASTAVFSVLHAVLLRPFPYPDPDRLVVAWSTLEGERMFVPLSAPDYYDWREQNRSFVELGVQVLEWVNLSGGARPERVRASLCTASLLRATGVAPSRGRFFTDDEERAGDRVAIIGDGLRRRWFGGDADVIGRRVVVDREPRTIVGLMPPGFEGPRPSPVDAPPELWLPMPPEPHVRVTGTFRRLHALGRLRPGVSRATAEKDLAAIAADIARDHPDTNARLTAWIEPYADRMLGAVRRPLWLLAAAVGVLMLIASVNVAGMLLARNASRREELTVRASLGAGRGRLVRQLLTESLLLSALGGAAGVLLAWWGVEALGGVIPRSIPRAGDLRIDAPVLMFSLAAVLVTTLASGLAPARSALRPAVSLTVGPGQRSPAGGHQLTRAHGALLVAELALALVLAHGALLMLRSYLNVLAVPAGVDTDRTLVTGLTLPGVRYNSASEARQEAFWTRLVGAVESIPGVRAAGVAAQLPFEGVTTGTLLVEGENYDPDVRRPAVAKSWVSPGYFAAAGLPLVAGRLPAPVDPSERVFELVVNQSFVRQYWPDGRALGRAVRSNSPVPNWSGTVVGVVGDARQQGLESPPLAEIYYPLQVSSGATRCLVVGVTERPRALAGAIRDAVEALDPDLAISSVRTMGDVVGGSTSRRRFQTLLVQLFAAAALALVLGGVYAMTSYLVSARTREIGIRMALGAERATVVAALVRRGLRLAAAGAAIGTAAALLTGRLTVGLLYGVGPADPATLAVAALLALGVTVAGTSVPALRAASVDPTVALRAE